MNRTFIATACFGLLGLLAWRQLGAAPTAADAPTHPVSNAGGFVADTVPVEPTVPNASERAESAMRSGFAGQGAFPPPAAPTLPPINALTTSAELDADERAEDEEMRAADSSPELREWRMAWADERVDQGWTQQLRDDVESKAKSLLDRGVKLSQLSCRETVCRMYLQFADQLDAQAFVSAPQDPAQRYSFQSLDPEFDGAGFDRSDFTYELLIQRARPADLPPNPAPEHAESPSVIAANASAEGEELVMNGRTGVHF